MQPSPIRFHRAPDDFGKLLSGDIWHWLYPSLAEQPSHKVGVVFASVDALKGAHGKVSACKFVELGSQRLARVAVNGVRQLGEPSDKLLV